MKELIEKLKDIASDFYDFDSISNGNTINEAIQALTSVKSEQIKQGKYSIELVDDGLYKLFVGRDNEHHGAWICSLCEFDANKEATIKTILDALNKTTEVKSESAEEVLESIKKEAEGRYPYETHINKNDSPYLIHNSCFIAGAKWMHDFANADKKQHAIGYWQFMVVKAVHNYSKKSDEELYNEYLNTLTNKEK